MPSLRVQANALRQSGPDTDAANEAIKRGMMADLGTVRIDELPLDDTPNPRAIPPRPRRTVRATEHTMAKNGIDDAEAMTVKDLNDLGGPSVYRPTAGPSRDFLAESRRPLSTFQGMKTSHNGILIPPGAPVHRFPSNRAVAMNAITASNNAVGAANLRPEHSATVAVSKNTMPPHLRAKKTAETTTLTNPGARKEASAQPLKQPTISGSKVAQEKDKVVPLIVHGHGGLHSSVINASTANDGLTTERGGSGDQVLEYWSGFCNTRISGQGQDCEVSVVLAVHQTAQDIDGKCLFVMTLPTGVVKRYSMRSYLLQFQKSNLCVVCFDSGAEKASYRLKFKDETTASEFQRRAANLQRVVGYVHGLPTANTKTTAETETASSTKKTADREEPAQPEPNVSKGPVEGLAKSAREKSESKPVTENGKLSGESGANTSLNQKDIADVMVDAFRNLSLDNIKDAEMYKANRNKVRYSAQELLERRASAEAPPGIKDINIPLNQKVALGKKNTPVYSPSTHDSAKLVEFLSGKEAQQQTEESRMAMPGLSMAVQCQKAAAATSANSLAQELSLEEKSGKTVAYKTETELDDNAKKNTKGTAADKETEISVKEISSGHTAQKASNSDDVAATIKTEASAVQATLAEKAEASAISENRDGGAAVPNDSNDSSIEFQPSPKDERPSTVATDQQPRKTMNATAPAFNMVESVPTATAANITAMVKQDDSAKESASAAPSEAPVQSAPMMSPTTTSATAPVEHAEGHLNHAYGSHSHADQGLLASMPLPHMALPGMTSPLMTTPSTAQPNVAYNYQMHSQPMIPGIQQYPPAGVVHSMSVTYHISLVGTSDGPGAHAGQTSMHPANCVTDFNGNQASSSFSPVNQSLEPQSQGQASQQIPSQNRKRRGLESSMFATGYSGAKFAGSFTGKVSE
ncbi:hypothetical protein CTA2_10714 [Colletotrichum tanaceti]|uniref:Uncharacterized protein n=1 Tax=Colletotrichum tanaceti TaxID=1306861 RepID=A0A4U6XJC3_9PEZI|nr:hypothetical protein CTA2_10714 [Colletotrichum tanaceti]TKW56090.1 hypothetical protein CTA1_10906 [Colletotrichum tanaceti]